MPRIARFLFADDDEDGADRRTASLAGLAVALFLVVIGLYLVRALHAKCVVEDCLMSGRTNCDALLQSDR